MKKTLYLVVLIFLLQHSTVVKNQLFGQTIIQAQTGYYTDNIHYNWTEEWYKINGSIMSYSTCCDPSGALKIVVIDSASCNPWESQGIGNSYFGTYGEYHCQEFDTPCFDFYISDSDSTQNVIANFISLIPQNDYVLVMSHKNHHCQSWNSNLINAFSSLGSSINASNRITDGYPYIMFGYKGAIPGSVQELIGNATGNLILLTDSMSCSFASINDIVNDNGISVYPNPCKGVVNIDNSNYEINSIKVFDLTGRVLYYRDKIKDTNKTAIDLSGLNAGLYFLEIGSRSNVFIKRIIIEK